MAYIGNKPTVGNFQICDAISVVNGQAAYTMQVGSVNVIPQSANHMIVSLNGTIQKPNSSFTVSGSTITFASNLATGDVIDFIQILGNVLDLGVPSDATVTTAKLADGAITSAKLASGVGGVAGITSSADATAITIDSSEQVGIGTTSPAFKLEVNKGSAGDIARFTDGVNANTVIKTDGSITTFGPDTTNSLAFQTNNTQRMRIDTSGQIILTHTPPIKTFDLGTTANFTLADGAHIEFTSTSGVWFVTEQSQTGLSAILLAGGGQTAIGGQTGSSYNNSDSGTFRWYRPSGQGYYFKNSQGNSCSFSIFHISLRNSN